MFVPSLLHPYIAFMLLPPRKETHPPLRLRHHTSSTGGGRLTPRIGNRVPKGMMMRNPTINRI